MPSDAIKYALKLMPYGFYSLTSRYGDDINAMVCNWVTQVSFEPRLLIVGLQKTCYTYELIEKGGVFTLNIFKAVDKEALMPFTKGRDKRPDKMENTEYTEAPETGCPILKGAAAYIECRMIRMINANGDHDILVGEVIGGDILQEAEVDEILTLVDLGWSYAG